MRSLLHLAVVRIKLETCLSVCLQRGPWEDEVPKEDKLDVALLIDRVTPRYLLNTSINQSHLFPLDVEQWNKENAKLVHDKVASRGRTEISLRVPSKK